MRKSSGWGIFATTENYFLRFGTGFAHIVMKPIKDTHYDSFGTKVYGTDAQYPFRPRG